MQVPHNSSQVTTLVSLVFSSRHSSFKMANIIQQNKSIIINNIHKRNGAKGIEEYIDSLGDEATGNLKLLFNTCLKFTQEILIESCTVPPALQVLLDRGFYYEFDEASVDNLFYTNIVDIAASADNIDAVKVLLSNDYVSKRICSKKQRILMKAGVKTVKFLLDNDDFTVTTEALIEYGIQCSSACLRIILNHPKGRFLLHAFDNPTMPISVDDMTFSGGIIPHIHIDRLTTHLDVYMRLDDVLCQIRKEVMEQNRRALFWGAILAMRIVQFQRRCWGPGGIGFVKTKDDFEILVRQNVRHQ